MIASTIPARCSRAIAAYPAGACIASIDRHVAPRARHAPSGSSRSDWRVAVRASLGAGAGSRAAPVTATHGRWRRMNAPSSVTVADDTVRTFVRQILLYDTRSRSVRPLEPRDPGRVGIYACGPTVYDRIHVGNARPFVVFTLLKRFLEHEAYDVSLVVNVTDVNDKIYDAARPLGVPSAQLAAEMTAAYRDDTDLLELGRPDHEPLASETIG